MNNVLAKTQKKEEYKKEYVSNGEKESAFDDAFSFSISEKDARRLPRSPLYMETIGAADLLSRDDKEAISKIRELIGDDATEELALMSSGELENEIKEVMEDELPDNKSLIGVVCRCYIDGCDCHEITPLGKIKEHFRIGQDIPSKLSSCRQYLQEHNDCTFVEVYDDCIVAISKDSTAKIL